MLNAENAFELELAQDETDLTESPLEQTFASHFNDAEYKRWLDTLASSKPNGM